MIKTMISNDFDVAYSVYYCIAILWSLRQILIFISREGCHRVRTGHGKIIWKVMELKNFVFQAWKVMEN